MLIVAITILIIGVSACERISQVVQPIPSDIEDKSKEISIGVVLPLTGHLASTGELMKQGFDLALGEINKDQLGNTQFKFIIEDDSSTPEGAIAAFNKLIDEDGVSVIFGPASSSATGEAFPIAQENQVVAFSATAGARGLSEIGDFVFQFPAKGDTWIAKGVEATHEKLGYQRVAKMYDETDRFSSDRDQTFQKILEAKGIEVLTTETFKSGDTDFSKQLNRIKALNPDAIFVSALPPEKPKVLIQQHQLGISAPFIITSLTAVEVQAAGVAAEGAVTFTSWLITDNTPGNQAFIESYRSVYGTDPSGSVISAYVATYILAEAIKNAQSTDAAAVRDALQNIRDFDTLVGKFSFDADGSGVYDSKVVIVKDSTLQPFK